MRFRRRILILGVCLTLSAPSQAGEVLVACASNFAPTLERAVAAFERDSEHTVTISTGSTGTLYAKIVNGAPYDVLLAADAARPTRLEDKGFAAPGSRFTYALGRLVLFSRDPKLIDDGPRTLRRAPFRRLAIANPKTAPYGAAARQVLERLGQWRTLAPRIVRGENVGQAFQYVATGNAQLGFVALSQVLLHEGAGKGSRWEVPQRLYSPLEQQAVLLEPGRDNAAARALLDFLRSAPARTIIESAGYVLPPQ